MAKRNQQAPNSSKNHIGNVRIVDPQTGTDGLRVDRMITSLKNSESQTRVICIGSSTIASASGNTNQTIGIANISTYDEFVSMAQQFNLYRISGMRLDLYDINPSNVVPTVAGSYHTDGAVAYDFASTADLPDSLSLSAGEGKLTLSWLPKGVLEKEFSATTSPYIDLGGFSLSMLGNGQQAATKYMFIVKAIVDFRGRR